MSKLTLDQKIEKVEEQIKKEEQAIELSKEKIRKLNADLKALKSEKEQSFANDIIKLMKANGISQADLLSQLRAQTKESDAATSSPSETESDN